MGVIPLVGTKPVTIDREHTHIFIYCSCIMNGEQIVKETDSGRPTWRDREEKTKVRTLASTATRSTVNCKSCQDYDTTQQAWLAVLMYLYYFAMVLCE